MGQGINSSAFSEYLSKTSTTDVQSLARGLAPHDMRIFSFIGRSRPEMSLTGPSLLTEEMLFNDPRSVELRHELSKANEN